MVKVVNKSEVQQFINQKQQGTHNFLLDVRSPGELCDKPKLPTAVNIPIGVLEQEFKLTNEQFEKNYVVPKPSTDVPIVTYCAAGMRAQSAASSLHHLGYNKFVSSFVYFVIHGLRLIIVSAYIKDPPTTGIPAKQFCTKLNSDSNNFILQFILLIESIHYILKFL